MGESFEKNKDRLESPEEREKKEADVSKDLDELKKEIEKQNSKKKNKKKKDGGKKGWFD